ncbi:MAG: glutamine amidotransferase [Gammaproteobacteria bacterium]|nr:glutamine amidotransferase [Gammaproteobacteria bacterium]
MKLGILVTGHIDEPHFDEYVNYSHMFQQLFKKAGEHFEYASYDVCEEQWPSSVNECDAWLITGSASGVYDDTPWMGKLKKWIVHSHEQGIPMVGICFGHQIIAAAFAGKVEKYQGGWGVGPYTYQLNDLELCGLKEIRLNAVHQDQVIHKPVNARCVGRSDFCENAILMYGDSILTIQAHPEFTNEYEKDLLELHKGNAIALEPSQIALDDMNDNPKTMDDLAVAKWMARVLKKLP